MNDNTLTNEYMKAFFADPMSRLIWTTNPQDQSNWANLTSNTWEIEVNFDE